MFDGTLLAALLALTTSSYVLYALTSTGGTHDDYMHFLMAKYAIQHPTLYLNPWGKPFFTGVVSVAILLLGDHGLLSARIANIVMATGTLLVTFRLVLKIFRRRTASVLSCVLLAFTPAFFQASYSALTETSFAFLTSLFLYFHYTSRTNNAALMLSLSTLARLEAFLFIPIYAILSWRKLKVVGPILISWPLGWSFANYICYNDFWLLFRAYPLVSSVEIGWLRPGPIFWYPVNMPLILGWVPLFLCLAGLTSSIRWRNHALVHLMAGAFLAFNSLAFSFGLFGSSGLLRYFVSIAPLFGFYLASGFRLADLKLSALNSSTARMPISIKGLVFLAIVAASIGPTLHSASPFSINPNDIALVDAGRFLKDQGYTSDKVYLFHPVVAYYGGIDPFVHNLGQVKAGIPKGSIVVWESNYSPMLGLDREYLNTEGFRIVKEFESGYTQVIIYQR